MVRPLSECVARLRAAATAEYDDLIASLDEYAGQVTVAVTQAAPDVILIYQGRAQQALKIVQLLKERPTS